ncbi:MAG: Zn-dependent hydrolase [Gammaproteobacteria bacterium]
MEQSNFRIDGARLWQSLMDMAKIGATASGGCNRQALTDEDRIGRDTFCSWCEEAGCDVRIDEMGNIFARRRGRDASRDVILIGSHLDTQPTGGKFDGVYGVLSGLEIVRTLNAFNFETEGPVEIVVWTNEEGTRFIPAMNGSGVWAGVLDQTEAYAQRSANGPTFQEELQRIGYLGDHPARPFPVRAAFEAHIEQGPILEADGKQIGVVTGVQGMRWYDLIIDGVPCHAGTTPMTMRRDPVRTMARIMSQFLDDVNSPDSTARATFGVLHSEPASRNTVPQRVQVSVDLRHPDIHSLDELEAQLRNSIESECKQHGTTGELNCIWDSPAVVFDPVCVNVVRNASRLLDYRFTDIVSGAGHDSVYVSGVAPTSMIFVPCAGGLSHNEAESATSADLAAGCNVLLQAVLGIDAKD